MEILKSIKKGKCIAEERNGVKKKEKGEMSNIGDKVGGGRMEDEEEEGGRKEDPGGGGMEK